MIANKLLALVTAALAVVAPVSMAAETERYRGDRPHRQDCIMYEVRPGDYCYKIARNNGISYEQLLRQNPGLDCTNLQIGQSICLVPLSNSWGGWGSGWSWDQYDDDEGSRDLDTCRPYVVKEGELCSRIAEAHGLSFAELVELNDKMSSWGGCKKLYAGQRICV